MRCITRHWQLGTFTQGRVDLQRMLVLGRAVVLGRRCVRDDWCRESLLLVLVLLMLMMTVMMMLLLLLREVLRAGGQRRRRGGSARSGGRGGASRSGLDGSGRSLLLKDGVVAQTFPFALGAVATGGLGLVALREVEVIMLFSLLPASGWPWPRRLCARPPSPTSPSPAPRRCILRLVESDIPLSGVSCR